MLAPCLWCYPLFTSPSVYMCHPHQGGHMHIILACSSQECLPSPTPMLVPNSPHILQPKLVSITISLRPEEPLLVLTSQRCVLLTNLYSVLLQYWSKLFNIGHTKLIEIDIEMDPNLPLRASKPYTLPPKHQEWVRKELADLERAGIIQRSLSPYASPNVVIPRNCAPGSPMHDKTFVNYRK